MPIVWGIHNNQPDLDLIGGGFVAVGWDEIGDLAAFGEDANALKTAVTAAYPNAKPGAIPIWAGVLRRFECEMQQGDIVVAPNKADSTVSIGRVDGDYYWDATAEVHHHRRHVVWLRTAVPRVVFSKTARNEIGSAVTLFKVKRHADEFLSYLSSDADSASVPAAPATSDDAAIEIAEDEPNAERIETYTRDFVIESLHQRLDPYRFEHFTAALLRAMGYQAHATQASGDGGVDVIAHKDPLGLEPPIVKVQCKRVLGTIGAPDVQKLAGALAHGGSEVGLFVTLGSYSSDALHLERTRQDLRLINGTELVSLILAHYDGLDEEWRRFLPLRRVYVVDREPEAF